MRVLTYSLKLSLLWAPSVLCSYYSLSLCISDKLEKYFCFSLSELVKESIGLKRFCGEFLNLEVRTSDFTSVLGSFDPLKPIFE